MLLPMSSISDSKEAFCQFVTTSIINKVAQDLHSRS